MCPGGRDPRIRGKSTETAAGYQGGFEIERIAEASGLTKARVLRYNRAVAGE
ncbi:MAG: hypothetical protein AVDCRST_MAG25-2900 [uncultured Rubrobacteraceae bacterium]|uniref:Uncharacterized protein n=1 Tax=uncultured Rubrobacteraceae bacterium TaxID=349277 RepID=A0A6J4S1Y5_9ACTN|nr:MAG: hypothetical protein AVDCRST_MAG25-2900 [uncultured Rubrobacteraceae bacterium]